MKKINQYNSLGIDVLITIIAIIVYSIITKELEPLAYVQFVVGPVVLVGVLFLNYKKWLCLPTEVSYLY